MLVKLVQFSDTSKFDADDVVSICPAQSEGYFYIWLRGAPKNMEPPADNVQIPGGVIMPDNSRIAALEKRVAALEAVVKKIESTNTVRPKKEQFLKPTFEEIWNDILESEIDASTLPADAMRWACKKVYDRII